MKILTRIRRFHEEELAATATEYAVMLAVIVIGVLVALQNLGQQTQGAFQDGADIMADINE